MHHHALVPRSTIAKKMSLRVARLILETELLRRERSPGWDVKYRLREDIGRRRVGRRGSEEFSSQDDCDQNERKGSFLKCNGTKTVGAMRNVGRMLKIKLRGIRSDAKHSEGTGSRRLRSELHHLACHIRANAAASGLTRRGVVVMINARGGAVR